MSSDYEDSYESDDGGDTKKRQRSKKNPDAKKNQGRPAKKPKYEFNNRDKKVMEEAVKKYGNSYATIAKEYFGDCKPTVTRSDISNFINSNPHLKQFCQTGTFMTIII